MLRGRGFQVTSAAEHGWELEDDESLWNLCLGERAALLTNNVADFMRIAIRWSGEGRSHFGLVFSSDVSMPRNRSNIGAFVTALETLLTDSPAEEGLADRIHWL